MSRLRGSVEHFPDLEELNARTRLMSEIEALSYVATNSFAPHLTVVPPGPERLLAIRQEDNRFDPRKDVVQILTTVIRAGSHGFGIATAHGARIPNGVQPYMVKLNADPEHDVPRFISALLPSIRLEFGGKDGSFPEIAVEGQHFVVKTNKNNEIRLQNKQAKHPFELITAVDFPNEEEAKLDPLRVHPKTWSLPPDFLVRSLNKAVNGNSSSMRRHRRNPVKLKSVA